MNYSEFEVQAEAFFQLQQSYPNVRGEYYVSDHHGGGARLDIAVLDLDNEIMFAVEVKRNPRAKPNTKQIERYRRIIDAPVILIAGIIEASQVAEIVKLALREELT